MREKCLYLELFWSAFSRIRTEYGKMRTRITPNTDTFNAVENGPLRTPFITSFQSLKEPLKNRLWCLLRNWFCIWFQKCFRKLYTVIVMKLYLQWKSVYFVRSRWKVHRYYTYFVSFRHLFSAGSYSIILNRKYWTFCFPPWSCTR